MPTYCAVPCCKGSGGFKFPADPELNLKWRVAIKRFGKKKALWKPSPHSTVCARHFTCDDFKEPTVSYAHLSGRKRRDLRPNAVPSVFDFAKPASSAATGRANRLRQRSEKKIEEKNSLETIQDPEPETVQEPEQGIFLDL